MADNSTGGGGRGSRGAFFVGYLKMPRALGLFLSYAVPMIAAAALGAGLVMATTQPDPGGGRYQGPATTLTGIIEMEPHPVLYTIPDAEYPQGRALALTRFGKNGVVAQAAPLAGQFVDVTGVYLIREDFAMFELRRTGIVAAETAPDEFALPEPEDLGEFTLSGEIVDSKCCLGSMLPGVGKPHMACAQLCLIGGVPAMFQIMDEAGDETLLLLADAEGQDVSSRILDYVSLGVEMTGQVERRGPMLVFRIDPATIRVL